MNTEFYIALFLGVVFSHPFISNIFTQYSCFESSTKGKTKHALGGLATVFSILLMSFVVIYSSAVLISGSHNPFLYSRF